MRKKGKSQRILAVLLVLATAAVAIAFILRSRSSRDRDELLAFVPADAGVLVVVDARALLKSAFHVPVERYAASASSSAFRQRCGFDPALAAKRVVLFLPNTTRLNFTIVAELDQPRERIVPCAQAVIEERGAKARITKGARFDVIESETEKRGIGRSASAIAAGEKGVVLIGESDTLTRMMIAADNGSKGPGALSIHDQLRREAASLHGPSLPLASLSVALDPKEKASLRDELFPELDEADRNGLDALLSTQGILLTISQREADIELHLDIACDRCRELRPILEAHRTSAARAVFAFPAVQRALENAAISADERAIHAVLRARAADVETILGQFLSGSAPGSASGNGPANGRGNEQGNRSPNGGASAPDP